MRQHDVRRSLVVLPVVFATALLTAACGGGGNQQVQAAQQPNPTAVDSAAAPAALPAAEAPAAAARSVPAPSGAQGADPAVAAAKPRRVTDKAASHVARAAVPAAAPVHDARSGAQLQADQKISDAKNGATDIGVTKDAIKLGSVSMHGMALGNILVEPVVRANQAAATAINDRGGVLGRRLTIADCDDGPGEVSRAKACVKKLAGVDHIFSLITAIDWATASLHDDLHQFQLPYVGAWAYSQTEWQDPYMFPTHMSMIHEAMAGAHWAANVVQPKTYGLICLTSPEMQLACNEVTKVMDASGSKLVKRVDVSISETSMSAYVLAMRAANPEHIIHYVINPATMVKFFAESAQQNYWPPKGISGNHLAGEVVGSLFGKWPAGRYWTNTTYKMWGTEYMATMNKYAPGNHGLNHHITQAGYQAVNIFAQAAKAVGPNLTRQRLMAELGNSTVWSADASMGQKFSYAQSERTGDSWSTSYGQGQEYMYEYMDPNTVSNPDGSPQGWRPDPNQFVVHTNR